MSSTIFLKLKESLLSYIPKLNEVQISNLIEVFKHYENNIVPINVVKREILLDYDEVYKLLTYLSKQDLMEVNFKIWCDHVQDTNIETVYRAITDIPLNECGICEKGCKLLNNVIVVFRVII